MSFLLLSMISAAAVLASVVSSPDSSPLSGLHHASLVTSSQLEDLRRSSALSFVYFFARDSPSIRTFLDEYEKSAKYLKVYSISLAVFDCLSDTSDQQMCKKEKVGLHAYTYLNGNELLTLSLETMFDVDSIMANALHLTLLHQIPIIHSQQERQEVQKTVLGKQDILIAYPEAFGTYEHRAFMEVAYMFQDKFKFAVTTKFKAIQDLKYSEALKSNQGLDLWVLFCSSSNAEAGTACKNELYRGNISLTALANFVQKLEKKEKTVYHVPEDGVNEVFAMTDTVPIIFLYTSKEFESQTRPVVKLVETELMAMAKLIVVDMDNKDCRSLAEQQGVSGKLPALGIKQNEAITFLDQSKGWSLDSVHEFFQSTAFPIDKFKSHSTGSTTRSNDEDISTLILEVQKQDDQIAEAVIELSNQEMELNHVSALLKQTFYTAIKSASLKVVLFYSPFDHISLAFLREYGHAAETLAKNYSESNVLARVNCFDGTDLCAAENITMYPLVRVFQRDQESQDYLGSLDSGSVIKAVKLLQLKSPVKLTNKEEVQKFMAGEHPQLFQNFTPSSVLLLASEDGSEEEKLFNNVAKAMSMKTALGIITGPASKSVAKMYEAPVPSVVAYSRNDPDKPIRILQEKISESALEDFIMNSLIASVPELTVMNLPALYAKKKPFVILFMDPSSPTSEVSMATFKQVAMSGQFDNALFCWMNAQPKTIGSKILSAYTWIATLPMITIVDHSLGELFNLQHEELELETVREWLAKVFAKKVAPSKTLEHTKWVPPGPHYDFLAMIDKMESSETKTDTVDDDYWFQVEQQRKERQLRHETSLSTDSMKREELMELRKSRLNQQRPQPQVGEHASSSPGPSQPHIEL